MGLILVSFKDDDREKRREKKHKKHDRESEERKKKKKDKKKKKSKEEKTKRRFPHYSLLECLGYFASGSENICLPLHLHVMTDTLNQHLMYVSLTNTLLVLLEPAD